MSEAKEKGNTIFPFETKWVGFNKNLICDVL